MWKSGFENCCVSVPNRTGDAFTVCNLTEILQAQEASLRLITLLLVAIASVTLLVGGIGIMNIMADFRD